MLSDKAYLNYKFIKNELEHGYGDNVHVLSNPYLRSLLSNICEQGTDILHIIKTIEKIYESLFMYAVNSSFLPSETVIKTRMISSTQRAQYQDKVLKNLGGLVVVDVIRGGIIPSLTIFQAASLLKGFNSIHLDHIFAERVFDKNNRLKGVSVDMSKVFRNIENKTLIISDPMAATGRSVENIIKEYYLIGEPKKILLLHLIITPEYIKNIASKYKNVEIFSVRVDRGMSDIEVLNSNLGKYKEKGLDDNAYIVPGFGDLGKVLNEYEN